MKRTTPYTKRELNERVRHYCDSQFDRMVNHRIAKTDYDTTKTDAWDLTLVAVSCSSKKSPYKVADAHNCTTLKKCHPTLASVMPCPLGQKPPRNMEATLGIAPIAGKTYDAGHCAEPHAVQKLLNKTTNAVNLQINDIDFSEALMVKNKLSIPYCRTCKLTFKQLR